MRHTLYSVLTFAVLAIPAGAQELTARADSVMRAAETRGFSGVVRVKKDGRVVLEQGYGLANRERKIRFTPATVVQIGSNTKDFTVVAILQLKERGLLDLNDPLSKFFPPPPPTSARSRSASSSITRLGFPSASVLISTRSLVSS